MAPRITDFRDHVKVTINSGDLLLQDNELPKSESGITTSISFSGSKFAVLGCAAQSYPPPRFSWHRKSHDAQLQSLSSSSNLLHLSPLDSWSDSDIENTSSSSASSSSGLTFPTNANAKYMQLGGVLYINRLSLADAGMYVCIVNSTLSEERAETELQLNGMFFVVIFGKYYLLIQTTHPEIFVKNFF